MDGPDRLHEQRREEESAAASARLRGLSRLAELGATNLATAVQVLEANARRPGVAYKFVLILDRAAAAAAAGQSRSSSEWRRARDEALHFRRFVDVLARSDLGVHGIEFVVASWDGLPEDGMERLFDHVLPSHPTILSIAIRGSNFPTRFTRLFTSSVLRTSDAATAATATATAGTTPTLARLHFTAVPIRHEDVQAIADMVGRNVALAELAVDPTSGDGLDAEDGDLLGEAVSRNPHIRALNVRVKEISADALGFVAGASSPLRELEVWSSFSEASVSSLAAQLRTNTRLVRLVLLHEATREPSGRILPHLFRPIEDALESFNYSLRDVDVRHWLPDSPPRSARGQRATIQGFVRRNRRIQRALEQLAPRSYHVSPTSLLPSVLEMVRPLPTLLYRFLRKGDVNRLCDLLLQPDENVRGSNKRGRDAGDGSVCEELEG
jgi:hypothetical protein